MIKKSALDAVKEYVYELETGDRGGRLPEVAAAPEPTEKDPPATAEKPKPVPGPSVFDKAAEYSARRWEKEKLKEWKEQGRIAEDGRLRVGTFKIEPYIMADIMRAMPHLSVMDRFAALIVLDGVVEEGFMDKNEAIRAVVTNIAEEAVQRYISTPEGKERIKEMADEAIGEAFETLFGKLKAGIKANNKSGKTNRCGRCGTPGHRKSTCKVSAEEGATMRAKAAAAAEPA